MGIAYLHDIQPSVRVASRVELEMLLARDATRVRKLTLIELFLVACVSQQHGSRTTFGDCEAPAIFFFRVVRHLVSDEQPPLREGEKGVNEVKMLAISFIVARAGYNCGTGMVQLWYTSGTIMQELVVV